MILIVGGTGYIGTKVTELLLNQKQHDLRIVARGRSDWESSVLPRYRRAGADVLVGDMTDRKFAAKATKGCKAIVNVAGVMRSRHATELEDSNVKLVENLVEFGQEVGAQRFIHLSCLGATEHTTGRYMKAKWQAENIVRQSSFYWTVFRPSIIFGPGSHLSRVLDFWVSRAPILIVVGSGLNRLQPVSGDDVATCIVQSIYNRETVKKTYDLMGPVSIDQKELLVMQAESEGKQLQIIKIPTIIGTRVAAIMAKLNSSCPIDGEVMRVLASDLVTDPDEPVGQIFEMKALPYSASAAKAIQATSGTGPGPGAESGAGSSGRRPRRAVEQDDEEDNEDDENS